MLTKFTRLTTSSKQADRFLTVQTREKPDIKTVASGKLFVLVEIKSRWFASAQIGQTLINTFFREYYRGSNKSGLANFELAIHRVNETLAQITQNGETDWIGKLNGFLLAADADEIYFSSVGEIEAYLFRQKNINQISEKKEGKKEYHPLKTFSNIVSGIIKANDSLLISNSALLDYIPLETLRQLSTACYSGEAALEIAKLLKKERALTVNCLILQFLTKEKASEIPTEAQIETIYLDQPLNNITGIIKQISRDYLVPSLSKIQEIFNKGGNYLYKQIKKNWENAAKNIKAKNINKKISQKIYNVHLYNKPSKLNKSYLNKLAKLLPVIKTFANRLVFSLNKAFKFLAEKKNRRLSYILGAATLIIILIVSIYFRHSSNTLDKKIVNFEQNLNRAKELVEEGKTSLIYKEEKQARKLFAEAEELARTSLEANYQKEESEKVLFSAQDQLDKLTKAKRFNDLGEGLTFPEPLLRIFEKEGKVYGISKNGKIYKGLLVEKNGSELTDLQIGEGKISSAILTTNKMLALSNQKKVFEIGLEDQKTNELKIKDNGQWEEAIDFSNFAGNLYLLDANAGQIWKHSSTGESFVAGGEYANARKINLKKGISLAIDGSVYVLESSGDIIKLSSGKQQPFAIKGIPEPNMEIINPARIYTETDTDFIYLLDGGGEKANQTFLPRILVFDKNGAFQRQYVFSEKIKTISDFFVRPKSNKGWILSENKVYEIDLE